MAREKIEAVLFDLGDTIFNFGRVSFTRLIKQAAENTYRYLKELDQPVGSLSMYMFIYITGLRMRVVRSFLIRRDFDSLKMLRSYGKKHGYTLTDKQYEHLNWLWYEPLEHVCFIEPDLRETLQALKEMNLKLGIISNTFVNKCSLDKHLRDSRLLEFFPVRLYSYQYPWRKPNTKIFYEGARQIDIPVQRILYIGDRIDNDVRPSHKVGMHAALIRGETNHKSQTPIWAHEIEKLSELPELIEQINSRYE